MKYFCIRLEGLVREILENETRRQHGRFGLYEIYQNDKVAYGSGFNPEKWLAFTADSQVEQFLELLAYIESSHIYDYLHPSQQRSIDRLRRDIETKSGTGEILQ